jgi:hypothetical protein
VTTELPVTRRRAEARTANTAKPSIGSIQVESTLPSRRVRARPTRREERKMRSAETRMATAKVGAG